MIGVPTVITTTSRGLFVVVPLLLHSLFVLVVIVVIVIVIVVIAVDIVSLF